MESQPQKAEFKNNPENFHPSKSSSHKEYTIGKSKLFDQKLKSYGQF